jgi:N-acetylmuramoyl-L-alanine amidase
VLLVGGGALAAQGHGAPPPALALEEPAVADAGEAESLPMVEAATYPLDTRLTVVLDAGHGGHDPGAVSADGSENEAEINQMMVDKVSGLLKAHEDTVRVVQAAQPGTYATTLARANTAVRQQAALLLSLHLNGDVSASTRGFQCFPAPPGRVYHAESTRFSELLVEQVRQTGIPILGTSGIYYCYYSWQGSKGYSKEILDAGAPGAQQPRTDESFGVVEFGGCPAVLIEQWHITNADDMALFHSDEGHEKMARCIYLAICAYLEIEPVER